MFDTKEVNKVTVAAETVDVIPVPPASTTALRYVFASVVPLARALLDGVGVIVIVAVILGVIDGVTDGVILGVTVLVGVTLGVTVLVGVGLGDIEGSESGTNPPIEVSVFILNTSFLGNLLRLKIILKLWLKKGEFHPLKYI